MSWLRFTRTRKGNSHNLQMLIVCVCLGFILIKKMCQFRLQLHNLQVNTCTKDSLEDKGNLRFLEFDVEQFYPTITKPLILKARLHTSISSEKEMILFHARKNVLMDCKKINNPLQLHPFLELSTTIPERIFLLWAYWC